jgi:hypothetical protein
MEFLEIKGISNSNGWTVVSIAPGYIVTILKPDNARVITILEFPNLRIFAQPIDRSIINLPVNPIITESPVYIHFALFVITTKNTGKSSLKWNYGTVENAIRGGNMVTRNNGIGTITPHDIRTALGAFLPWNIM